MIRIELACDGSGTTNGSPGGWAFILRASDTETGEILREREGCGGAVSSSSQKMELSACLFGLRALSKPSALTVISDSEYLLNGFRSGWVDSWKAKDWPRRIKNAALWKALDAEVTKHEIDWVWVRGHTGHDLNERCDSLAGDCRRAVKLAVEASSLDGLDFEVDTSRPLLEAA